MAQTGNRASGFAVAAAHRGPGLSMVDFPTSLDEIGARQIGQWLAERFPGTAVTGLDRGTVIHGTATKAEYFLRYNVAGTAHGLPPSLWLKCGLDTQIPEQAPHSTIEAQFFRDLAPLLAINLPRPFATAIAPGLSSGIVLYDDLNRRPVRFGTQTQPLSHDAMLDVLELLAELHAAFWRSEQVARFDWLRPGGVNHSNGVIDRFIDFWDLAAGWPRFVHVPESLRDKERMRAAIKTVLASDMADPVCVIHGDPHQGNMFFDVGDRPGLLDWATVMRGHWAWDVAYAMIGSQTVGQRRAREGDQLAHYLARLRSLGVDAPNIADARREYARHAIWIFLFALCPPELQPEELCTLSAERACAAIVDLDTLALIESASR